MMEQEERLNGILLMDFVWGIVLLTTVIPQTIYAGSGWYDFLLRTYPWYLWVITGGVLSFNLFFFVKGEKK
jgi:hypothetical protein